MAVIGVNDDPFLDEGVRGWIVKMAHKHYWRVAAWYEIEDLIQDGYLCYAKCRKSYRPDPNKAVDNLDDRRTFMIYLSRSFMNRITDLANSRTRTPEVVASDLSDDQSEGIETWTASASELSDASLASLLATAPAEIIEILKALLVEGKADGPYRKSKLRKIVLPGGKLPRIVKAKRPIRETTAEHFDRCLGRTGVVVQLRQYFLGETKYDLIDVLVANLFGVRPHSLTEE